jgi:hypothetical protein
MLGWLYSLVVGQFCRHRWDVIEETNLIAHEGAMRHGKEFILQCRHCGSLNSRRFK